MARVFVEVAAVVVLGNALDRRMKTDVLLRSGGAAVFSGRVTDTVLVRGGLHRAHAADHLKSDDHCDGENDQAEVRD
jgi:hypothetical protein